MRRCTSRILPLFVVVVLVLGSVPLGLAATSQPPGSGAIVTADGAATPALTGKQGKQKRERRQDRRQHDRKADRKHDRKKHKRQRQQQQQQQQQQDNQSTPAGNQAPPARELPTGVLPGAETVAPTPDKPISAKDHYIIRLRAGAGDELDVAMAIASGLDGVVPTHVYETVFSGFAAVIPPDKVDAVRADPRVEVLIPDQVVHAMLQTLPRGVDRIDADQNATARIDGQDERVDVDVAVIDSAGDDTHPDLNIWAWANCTPFTFNNSDGFGHGTHVGGIIGALDNNVGAVGVAPGARLWNINVFAFELALSSWVICGLDLVATYAVDQGDGYGDIEVANASVGSSGSITESDCATTVSDLTHLAYCRAVAAGVTVVVAAGNDAHDAALDVPAKFDEVIAVSALADSDGQPGGIGPDSVWGPDDTLAEFSNFGADIDLAAPGVAILSTVPTGGCQLCRESGYRHLSGTSMASPHVAGAAALYLATHPGASPAEVKAALLAAREPIHLPGDPDGIDEGVVNVGPELGSGMVAGLETNLAPAVVAPEDAPRARDTGPRDRRQGKGKPARHDHRQRPGR